MAGLVVARGLQAHQHQAVLHQLQLDVLELGQQRLTGRHLVGVKPGHEHVARARGAAVVHIQPAGDAAGARLVGW